MLPLLLLAIVALVVVSNLLGILIGFQKGWEVGYSEANHPPNPAPKALARPAHGFTLLRFDTPSMALDMNEPGVPSRGA